MILLIIIRDLQRVYLKKNLITRNFSALIENVNSLIPIKIQLIRVTRYFYEVMKKNIGYWLIFVLCMSLLAFQIHTTKPVFHFRFWKDVHLAIGFYLYGQIPLKGENWDNEIKAALTEKECIPYAFWKTLNNNNFISAKTSILGFPDDMGRGFLLGVIFKILGGISPYLLFWLGYIFSIPVLFWLYLELFLTNHKLTAVIFMLILILSSYFSGVLSLSYSAMAFYLLGCLSLLSFVFYSLFGQISLKGSIVRIVLCGIFIGICLSCRSGVAFLYPGFALALLILSKKNTELKSLTKFTTHKKSWLLRFGVFIISSFVFFLPSAILYFSMQKMIASASYKTNSELMIHHPVWHSIWAGMGDFDVKYGHSWGDMDATKAVAKAGGPDLSKYSSSVVGYKVDKKYEDSIKTIVIKDVTSDPMWYLEILLKRFFYTVFLINLLPWEPRDGESLLYYHNVIDYFYVMTASADFFKLGYYQTELPIEIFVVAFWFMIFKKMFNFFFKKACFVDYISKLVFLIIISGTWVALPVLISTAAAFETQVIMILYWFGFSYGIESICKR